MNIVIFIVFIILIKKLFLYIVYFKKELCYEVGNGVFYIVFLLCNVYILEYMIYLMFCLGYFVLYFDNN